jgi:hypothetical protein
MKKGCGCKWTCLRDYPLFTLDSNYSNATVLLLLFFKSTSSLKIKEKKYLENNYILKFLHPNFESLNRKGENVSTTCITYFYLLYKQRIYLALYKL